MKKLATLLALAGFLAAGNAMATDTATVNVTATVLGTCSFNTTNYTMDFGSISTTDTGNKTGSATLNFTCSNGTPWTLDDVSGSHTLTGAVTADTMAYTIASYLATGVGTGSAQTVDLNGTITQAVYQAASADIYNDSITVNINP